MSPSVDKSPPWSRSLVYLSSSEQFNVYFYLGGTFTVLNTNVLRKVKNNEENHRKREKQNKKAFLFRAEKVT